MNDNEDQESRPIDWSQIIPGLRAAGDLFHEKYGDRIAAFRQLITELNSRARAWIEEHEVELRHLSDGVAAFLEKLPEWQKNAEANLRLLERSLKALEESGQKSAGYILSVYEVTALGDLAPAELSVLLFEMTASEDFILPLMEFYSDTGLRPARATLLEEAHQLHASAGSPGPCCSSIRRSKAC